MRAFAADPAAMAISGRTGNRVSGSRDRSGGCWSCGSARRRFRQVGPAPDHRRSSHNIVSLVSEGEIVHRPLGWRETPVRRTGLGAQPGWSRHCRRRPRPETPASHRLVLNDKVIGRRPVVHRDGIVDKCVRHRRRRPGDREWRIEMSAAGRWFRGNRTSLRAPLCRG